MAGQPHGDLSLGQPLEPLSFRKSLPACTSGVQWAVRPIFSGRVYQSSASVERVALHLAVHDGGPVQARPQRGHDFGELEVLRLAVAAQQRDLPALDRTKLGEYLDDVREIERRIQKAENQSAELQIPEAPVGVPDSFDEHVKLMFDLQVLAYQAGITRISTMMFARDLSPATYPASGIRDGFHTCSHHSNNRANMDNFSKINRYHVETLAYFLDKLKSTPDGDGSLLDHSMILYGSSMADGNQHDHYPLPVLVVGGAFGTFKGGRHIRTADRTPMSNLLLTILNQLGIQRESFGDSKVPYDNSLKIWSLS